jgi:hypothetical protein
MHVFFSNDPKPTISTEESCCLSCSYVANTSDSRIICGLAICVSTKFAGIIFETPLFDHLRDFLLNPMTTKVCANSETASHVHSVLRNYFKITIPHFNALTNDATSWFRAISDTDPRELVIQQIDGDRFPPDPQTVIDTVKCGSFSSQDAFGPNRHSQSLRVAAVVTMHRAMVNFADGSSRMRRRIASRLPE